MNDMNPRAITGDNAPPTSGELHDLLSYDCNTGVLRWKERPRKLFHNDNLHGSWNRKFVGTEAGASDEKGYTRINILGRRYKAHRVALCMVNGQWPNTNVDHINGDPADNRISNLREASHAVNNKNTKMRSDNSSGVCGVYFLVKTGKWVAQIQSNGKKMHLGYFQTADDAANARAIAERTHGFHANHGRSI